MIKLGEGRTSIVFSDGEFAYKQYRQAYLNNMAYELHVQEEIYKHTNLNVCKYEAHNQELKMTLIDGVMFADRIRVEKYKDWLEDFVDLQCEVYNHTNIKLIDAHQDFFKRINESNLDGHLKNKAIAALQSIQNQGVLCHFDFHPMNILYKDNKYYIIDWINAKLGNPLLDIANTYIIFREYLQRQSQKYLNLIAKKTGFLVSDIIKALPVMACIKLIESTDSTKHRFFVDLIEGNDRFLHRK